MKFGLLTLFDHYAEDCSEEQYYKNFFDEVSYAEELGFDSIWIGEHHFCRYICPAPQIIAGAIAQRTKKIRIGTSIVLLPHHDPIRLAEDYALVDLLSGGRLDLGVGRGFIKSTYDGFNQSMDESRERFNECLEIIERAWSQPTFSYEGQFYKREQCLGFTAAIAETRATDLHGGGDSVRNLSSRPAQRGHSVMLAPFFQSRSHVEGKYQTLQGDPAPVGASDRQRRDRQRVPHFYR